MIDLDGITFGYSGNRPPVFDSFTWNVGAGETWAVTGPSGCGKSTLLLLLAGLLKPQSGTVCFGGQPLQGPSGRTGLVLQDYELLPWATILQNVMLGLRLRTHPPATGKEDALAWLDRLGIRDIAHRLPHEISGGQRQRAAIVRALMLEPELVLMDEPFSALDAPNREALQQLTLDMCAERRITLIVVTHNVEEACLMGQQILVLSDATNRHPAVLPNTHATGGAGLADPALAATCVRLKERLRVPA